MPFAQRPFGVNLIGHAFEMFGIGEDIRMAARALQAADVPCCVIHHPAANGSACSDRTLEPLICSDPTGGPYAFNLVCMADLEALGITFTNSATHDVGVFTAAGLVVIPRGYPSLVTPEGEVIELTPEEVSADWWRTDGLTCLYFPSQPFARNRLV